MNGTSSIIATIFTAASTLLASACGDTDPGHDLELELSMRSSSDPAEQVVGMGLGPQESWVVVATGEVKGWGQRYCDSDGCSAPLDVDPIDLGAPAVEVHHNGAFTAALLDDGRVLGWGPTVADALAPTQVTLTGPASTLAMGEDFLCAQLGSGAVQCRNIPGIAAPAWLAGFTSPQGVIALTAGSHHACARLSTQRVECWGANDLGQLGGPNASGTAEVPLSDAVAQVVAGGDHTCARLLDGTVECWGAYLDGQLGHDGPEPEAAWLDEPIADITAGAAHSCAIAVGTGNLYCWGANSEGQLAAGTDSAAGIRHVDLGGTKAARVLAGATASTTFVVLETGGLRGWGADDSGQAGYGDFFDDVDPDWLAGSLPDIPIFIPPQNP